MIQPRLVWELARKDLALFLADRRGAILCFVVPILLASVFGLVFHRPAEVGPRPRVFLVLEGSAPLLQRIADGLTRSEQVQTTQCDAQSAQRRLANETSGVIVTLPAELAKISLASLNSGKNRPIVALTHHPNSHLEARWVEGVLTEIVLREVAREMFAPMARQGMRLERPFEVRTSAESSGGALSVHAYSHSFCGITLQYLLFWGMDSGLLFLRERRQGIWRRLRAAPVSRLTLLSGKALATTLVALAQVLLTFGFGVVVFGVTIGSVAGFALMAVTAAILSAATGLLVAALGGNEGRARSVAILVILTLSLLGGLWLPAFLLPGWVQRFGLMLPTTWAARGLEGATWQGVGVQGVWPCALALIGFSTVFLFIAWWRLVRADVAVARG